MSIKINFKYDEVNDRWIGERLYFKENNDGEYSIINGDEELLGHLEKMRVGKFLHWALLLEEECYLTAGCVDEVREFMRKLGGKKNV